MNVCIHDLAERETACADGMCPLCLSNELASLQAKLTAQEAVVEAARPFSVLPENGTLINLDVEFVKKLAAALAAHDKAATK